MSINRIMRSLKELVNIHESLIRSSQKKTEIIKAGSPDKLQQLLVAETKLVNKLEQVESERQDQVNNWFIENDHPDDDRTITRMLELLSDEQLVVDLEEITTSLTKAITKLKQQEQLNENLIQQSMQFVQLSLDMLSPSIQNLNYGNEQQSESNDRSIFDSQA